MSERVTQFEDSALSVLKRQRVSVSKAIWLLLYYTVGQRLPDTPLPGCAVANRLRHFLCGRLFKRLGSNTSIHAGVVFGSGRNVELGDNSSLNHGCWIANDTKIGNDVMMGPEVVILSSSHNFSDTKKPMREQGSPDRNPVTIGDDVWIGTRVILLPGVMVGSHSIIGAGSVVTKDVEPWSIVAGNPARIIRFRLSPVVNSGREQREDTLSIPRPETPSETSCRTAAL